MISNTLRFIIFTAILSVQFHTTQILHARWAKQSDANVECMNKTVYDINADGTYTVTIDQQLKILNENGRQNHSIHTLTFDKTLYNMEVLEAKTIFENQEYIISADEIETKPLASDPTGVRKNYQILIPYKNSVVGSVLHLKYKMVCFKTQVPEYFGLNWFYDYQLLWNKNSEIIINSKLPLNIKVNDPRKRLNITEKHDANNHAFKVSLKEDLLESIIFESDISYLEPEKATYISFSSEKDFGRFGRFLGKNYETILTASLPKPLKDINSQALLIKDEKDQITTILSKLSESISYLHFGNTAEAHIIPRKLEEIVQTGYGDCKDYSVCLAAILRSLGYNAKVALVTRSDIFFRKHSLPTLAEFNHAIVKIIGKTGKTYWIDPTNITAMSDGIYPDIADRPALVLDPTTPVYENIPPVDYHHAVDTQNEIKVFNNTETISTKGNLKIQGESAIAIHQQLIAYPKSVIEEGLIKNLCATNDARNIKISIPERKSRKVENMQIDYQFEEDAVLQTTNYGVAIPLRFNWARYFPDVASTNEGALFIGIPETTRQHLTYKGVYSDHLNELAFAIDTPWINAKRELHSTKDGIEIVTTLEIMKSIITPEEIRTDDFKRLKTFLRKFTNSSMVVSFSKL